MEQRLFLVWMALLWQVAGCGSGSSFCLDFGLSSCLLHTQTIQYIDYSITNHFVSMFLWLTSCSLKESWRYVPYTNFNRVSFSCLFWFAKIYFNPPNPPGLPTRLGFFAGIGRRAAGGPAMMKWELKLRILQAGIAHLSFFSDLK